MELTNITYQGPAYYPDDKLEISCPENLISILKQINGFIQFGGGLHVRGSCTDPNWHSLQQAMNGDKAIHKLFPGVSESDVPFAQDCMADQYLLRNNDILKLHSETGEIESLSIGLSTFFSKVSESPQEFLGLEPLIQLQNENQSLEPGQVIHVYPPFCCEEASDGVSLKPVSVNDALSYLSSFSAQIRSIGDGDAFEVNVEK